MHRAASLVVVLSLAGCSAPSYQRSHDVDASLPRAIGLGSFASTCLFLCYVRSQFTRGGDESNVDDSDAHFRSQRDEDIKGKGQK